MAEMDVLIIVLLGIVAFMYASVGHGGAFVKTDHTVFEEPHPVDGLINVDDIDLIHWHCKMEAAIRPFF